jgi:hypothetical protein
METHTQDARPVFDSLDIDLVIKVLERTVFSECHLLCLARRSNCAFKGPFFVLLVVLFYVFHGARYTDPQVRIPSIYFIILSLFCMCLLLDTSLNPIDTRIILGITKWCSKLWRNKLSPVYRSSRLDWGEQIILITGGTFALALYRSAI